MQIARDNKKTSKGWEAQTLAPTPSYTLLAPNETEEISSHIKLKYPKIEIDELLKESLILGNEPSESSRVKKLQRELKFEIKGDLGLPRFPFTEGPRDYQKEAYDKWYKNDKKGLLAMATGTGKTLTSLNCLLNEYMEIKAYKAVIIVPTIALVDQWRKECQEFNFNNIIIVTTKEKWPQNISFINTANNFTTVSFIIIVTYATFYRKRFQQYFKELPSDTLLIADETHNIGSEQISKVLPTVHLEKRLGLSATPDRPFDHYGNSIIEKFFNDKPPFIFSYTMEEAMARGWLCKYEYYPHIVKLTKQELEQYRKLSKDLMRFFDLATRSYEKCTEVEILLLRRKRIIHKAFNKLGAFKKILLDEFKKRNGTLSYTLIYVPEGIEANYDDTDNYVENNEDISLIDLYTKEVRDVDPSITVSQFTANTNNKSKLIENFQNGDTHVLTSMKCLDEGVDVPRSELAIFCASTGNPRQFIQRRGRVLRTHDDKQKAVIHDLVVVPDRGKDESTLEMEKNLISKELHRVKDFSSLALNKIDTYIAVKEILDIYNINLYN